MKKKLLAFFLLLAALVVSFGAMLLPTFFTKNISRVALSQSFSLEHILEGEKSVELLFFGYAGCADVCSPRLYALSEFYEALSPRIKERLGVRFVDISSPEDVTFSKRFAEYFHQDFDGVYLQKSFVREYAKEFGIFFAPSLSKAGEFDHTANLYIVQKKGSLKRLRYIYAAFPYDFEQMREDIEELLSE